MCLGIHRSVELIRRPRGADIVDYQVQADATGHITCHVECRRPTIATATADCQKVIVARLYKDEQLTADGDVWKAGPCVWTASTPLDHKNETNTEQQQHVNTVGLTLSGDIDASDLSLWTAETPHLYTLTLSLEEQQQKESKTTTSSNTTHQAESCRVGFRTVDIRDGAVHVNGRRITVCGMNRHEHCPDHGKVVSFELMKKDCCLLK